MFFHALLFARSRGICLNIRLSPVLTLLLSAQANVKTTKQRCMMVTLIKIYGRAQGGTFIWNRWEEIFNITFIYMH